MSAGSEQKQTSERQVLPLTLLEGLYVWTFITAGLAGLVAVSFGAGFYVGKYTQMVDVSPAAKVEQNVVKEEIKEETEKSEVENALENDAQFKKIHDFLLREYPVEFKVPELPKRQE